MATNLLSVKLSRGAVIKVAKELDLRLDINEGGHVSKDRAVILIENRSPYNGMLLQYSQEAPTQVLHIWVNRVMEVLKNEHKKV